MSAPEYLNDLYTCGLQDPWSANDQMGRTLKKMLPKVSDPSLKGMLSKSQKGIAGHTDMLKQLLAETEEKVKKEHCKAWKA